jgi:hypothetical protein
MVMGTTFATLSKIPIEGTLMFKNKTVQVKFLQNNWWRFLGAYFYKTNVFGLTKILRFLHKYVSILTTCVYYFIFNVYYVYISSYHKLPPLFFMICVIFHEIRLF